MGPTAQLAEISAVVFDMDGLLLDTEALARRAFELACTEFGLALSETLSCAMIGVPADSCRRLLLDHYGEHVRADPLFAASARHLEEEIEKGALHVKPGVDDLLAHLERIRMPHAVATSSAREKALRHLRIADVAESFDCIITRDDVARGKPYPDLFLGAARCLGVDPEHCLALEDSYNGVRAAHAAAMPVIMVPDLLPPTDEMRSLCAHIVSDLHAVVPLLSTAGTR